MKPLIEPCKSAIHEGRCLGCNRLEDENFIGDKKCKYGYRICNKTMQNDR